MYFALFSNREYMFLLQFQWPSSASYCPKKTVDFKDTMTHLVTKHCNKEIKFIKFDDSYLRALNFKVIPDLCRKQGREITLNESKEIITKLLRCYEVHIFF